MKKIKFAVLVAFFWGLCGPAAFAQVNILEQAAEEGIFPFEFIDTTVTVNRNGDFDIVRKVKYVPKKCRCSRSYSVDTKMFGEIKNVQVFDSTTQQPLIYAPYAGKRLSASNPSSHGKFTYYRTRAAKENYPTFYHIDWYFSPKDADHIWEIRFTVNGIVTSNNLGELAYWDVYFDDQPAGILKVKVVFPEGITYDTINPWVYRGIGGVKFSKAAQPIKATVVEDGKAAIFELKQIASDERINLALGIAPGVIDKSALNKPSTAKGSDGYLFDRLKNKIASYFYDDLGVNWKSIIFVLFVIGGLLWRVFNRKAMAMQNVIERADKLMSLGKREESKNLIMPLLEQEGQATSVFTDAVAIFVMGNMYAEAKNVFETYHRRTGKNLNADWTLDDIIKMEVQAASASESKVFLRSKDYSSLFGPLFAKKITQIQIADNYITFVKGGQSETVNWADIVSAQVNRFTYHQKYAGEIDACVVTLKTSTNKTYTLDLTPKQSEFEQYDQLMAELSKRLKMWETFTKPHAFKVIWIIAIVLLILANAYLFF